MQTLTFQVYMCHFFNQLVEFSAWGGGGGGGRCGVYHQGYIT